MAATVGDPYEVLGVSPGASPEELRRARAKKARELHPDLNKGDPSATRKMQDVNIAYDSLVKDQKRKAKHDWAKDAEEKKAREEEQKAKQQQEQWERDQAQQQRQRERRTASVDVARVVDKREWMDTLDEAFAESKKGYVPPKAFNRVWDVVGDLFYNKDFGYLDSAPLFRLLEQKYKVTPQWTQAVLVAMERVGIIEFGRESSNPSDI